ncbi:MAG: ABC transporter substrate-binding protein [Clostridiales bacterium]|nr:ABC transporter substrate-binding protein [Clostridiales bacterium]
MKKLLSILLIMMMVFTFIGCESNSAVENNATTEEVGYYPVTFTDGMGREVTIESEPMTIVTMAPSMTETIYALGLGDRLVGRTNYCNYPEAALSVESIGSLREPNLEAIIALNPDLILMSTHASEEVLAKLDEAGLKTAILTAQESFDGVYEIVTQTGTIFNVSDQATELVSTMQADVTTVLNLVGTAEKKTVYYVVGFGEYGDYTATGDTFIHEMLEMAGGNNIAADGKSWSYNLETIIEKDPEYIICSELVDTKGTLEQTEGYMELTAIKEGRLVEINQDLLSRQGPRLAEGLKAIAQLLHPELFE